MNPAGWIWISRWEEFQHYKHERGKVPAWIKQYTRQLDDDRYLDLNPGERALLSDLRAEFARARSELKADRKRLSNRIGTTVYQRQLDRLNQAGFIEIIPRELLERRLERIYGVSRAEVEVEKEEDNPPNPNPALHVAANVNGKHTPERETDDIPL